LIFILALCPGDWRMGSNVAAWEHSKPFNACTKQLSRVGPARCSQR